LHLVGAYKEAKKKMDKKQTQKITKKEYLLFDDIENNNNVINNNNNEHKLTDEQQNIISACSKYNRIKVLAYAGAGKTSTLIAVTKAFPNKSFLYLAFNKAIIEDAKKKFPANTRIVTVHGLAYSFIIKSFKSIKISNLRAKDLLDLGLDVGSRSLSYEFANFIVQVFDAYCYSDFSEINTANITNIINDDLNLKFDFEKIKKMFLDKVDVDKIIVDILKQIFDMMMSQEIEMSHNFYLKLFHLRINNYKKFINYDYVLLDEAQDTNDVTLAIFNALNGKKILVGDPYQKIYGFRKAVNGIEKFDADVTLRLTTSFRFNDKIANKANKLLLFFRKETVPIQTINKTSNVITTTAYISRTNAKLIEIIKELYMERKSFNTARSEKEIFKTPLTLAALARNKNIIMRDTDGIYDKFFLKFEGLYEVEEYNKVINDPNIEFSLKLLTKADYTHDTLLRLFNYANQNNKIPSDIVLTTAHSAKGLEWDKVVILDDFPDFVNLFIGHGINSTAHLKNMLLSEDFLAQQVSEELNLFYVAITRAKTKLICESSNESFIEQFSDFVKNLHKSKRKIEELKKKSLKSKDN
jgi:superfamily I DNA/RNA helicase